MFGLILHMKMFRENSPWEYFYPSWNYLGEFPIGKGEGWKQMKFPMGGFAATEAFH